MSICRLLNPADYRAMPWKNGLGVTLELAIEPPPSGPGLDPFLWRVSIATVATDGPFSAFPGYDRIILVLEGAGMALSHETGPAGALDPGDSPDEALVMPFAPHRFQGEWSTRCRLLEGPVRDFNVMTRRDVFTGSLMVHRIDEALELSLPDRGVLLVYAAQGRAEARMMDAAAVRLEPECLLRIDVSDRAGPAEPNGARPGVRSPGPATDPVDASTLRLSSPGGSTLLAVTITPAGEAPDSPGLPTDLR